MVGQLESESRLDPIADALRNASEQLTSTPAVRDVLQGHLAGHPMHAAATVVPVGLWISSLLVGDSHGRTRLLRLALLSAPVVGALGLADVERLDRSQARVTAVHVTANLTAGVLGLASLRMERQDATKRALLTSLLGLGALGAGGFLGGHVAARLPAPPEPQPDDGRDGRPLGTLLAEEDQR